MAKQAVKKSKAKETPKRGRGRPRSPVTCSGIEMTFEDLIRYRMKRLSGLVLGRHAEDVFTRQALTRLPGLIEAAGWGTINRLAREFSLGECRLDTLIETSHGLFVICEMKNDLHAKDSMLRGAFVVGQLLAYGTAFQARFQIEEKRLRLAAVVPQDNLWLNSVIGAYELPIHVFVIGEETGKFYGA